MLAEILALERLEAPWLGLHVLAQKFGEIALTDKADPRAVFFGGGGEPGFFSELSHFAFGEVAHRIQDAAQDLAFQRVEKIGLILARIESFEQTMPLAHAS